MSPKTVYDSSKVEVKYAGEKLWRGVFAKKRIKEGEVVERVPTIMITTGAEVIQDTDLAYYTYTDEEDASHIALGNGSLYNHSDKNNVDFSIAGNTATYIANRDIKKGEQLFIDYEWGEEWLKEFE